ncbi:uncharacterized protein RCC_07629 [Ramularia collo-cygni]|uniref:Uncharacterized protein n=1 Tax=Ramularia collo-cygni TaxID=112498 RepID=A0A2D3VFU4_9PEZI|nr:uncharacterized protein RCC_07629 [Ramularia collo-cygni]CZT21764.1 uncharacterized protein RCC_07629 [Ramularia collo-cygni]
MLFQATPLPFDALKQPGLSWGVGEMHASAALRSRVTSLHTYALLYALMCSSSECLQIFAVLRFLLSCFKVQSSFIVCLIEIDALVVVRRLFGRATNNYGGSRRCEEADAAFLVFYGE